MMHELGDSVARGDTAPARAATEALDRLAQPISRPEPT